MEILTDKEALCYGPLTLAYLGDGVFELEIRSRLVLSGDRQNSKLNDEARKFVSCEGQAKAFRVIEPVLTENETAVFKRGRNAYSHPHRNNSITDYKCATGLESVFGFLYLTGKTERITELVDMIFNRTNEDIPLTKEGT